MIKEQIRPRGEKIMPSGVGTGGYYVIEANQCQVITEGGKVQVLSNLWSPFAFE